MKKFLLFFLIFVTLFTFAGCGTEDNPPEEKPKEKYSITWIDENGKEITVTEVEEGKVPSYNYTVTDTAEWDYTFLGWSDSQSGEVLASLPAASKDVTYYAKASAKKQVYTVSFVTGDGSDVASQEVEYGSVASEPTAPTLDGYRFVGWSKTESSVTDVDWNEPITKSTVYYAVWNEKIDYASYLDMLLDGYNLNPYSYIPEAMRPAYSANLIDPSDIITDYSTTVNVQDIISHGYGEQWNMVIGNIEQSMTFYNLLSVVETLSSSAVVGFNNYLDTNTSDTANYVFENGIYNVTINCDNEVIYFVVDYTATLPALGEQTVQIALYMNVDGGARSARIQIGDANALTYTVSENSYEFAIKYLGVRRAYFRIEKDEDGNVSGHIYEHLTVSGVGISSAADFYVTEDYTVAIGNKANGMVGFTGTIAEVYDTASGKLIGYEVEETLSSIVYNTIFLDLDCFEGLNSLRYEEGTGEDEGAFYVNGSVDAWEAKLVGGLSAKMLSRRYDIEFRTQYFYYYDQTSDTYIEVKVEVPMLFVQEENYDTILGDIEEKNGVELTINADDADIEAITSFYEEMIPIFKTNKELVSSDAIIAFIGNKIVFTK